jgi:hypothetical protein
MELHQLDPATAQQVSDAYLAEKAAMTTGRPCPEWFDLALEVGWEPDQWPTMARVMHAESMCVEDAYNGSGATGLMQVMPAWADDCGGTASELFDAAFNLACALHVHDVSGWGAWSTY